MDANGDEFMVELDEFEHDEQELHQAPDRRKRQPVRVGAGGLGAVRPGAVERANGLPRAAGSQVDPPLPPELEGSGATPAWGRDAVEYGINSGRRHGADQGCAAGATYRVCLEHAHSRQSGNRIPTYDVARRGRRARRLLAREHRVMKKVADYAWPRPAWSKAASGGTAVRVGPGQTDQPIPAPRRPGRLAPLPLYRNNAVFRALQLHVVGLTHCNNAETNGAVMKRRNQRNQPWSRTRPNRRETGAGKDGQCQYIADARRLREVPPSPSPGR